MFFLGVDAGGTKTDLMVADHKGTVLALLNTKGLAYSSSGRSAYQEQVHRMLAEVLRMAGITSEDISHATIGIPSYGEFEETETTIPAIFGSVLPLERTSLVNDAVVAWSGSLSGRPGIHVVSGTGSIAYGMDQKHNEARAGGWSTRYGDEGSCSWIGIQAMKTFFRQADGRLPRTILYDLFKERFDLGKKDLYFIGMVSGFLEKDKTQFARLQLLAFEALRQGDPFMPAIYDQAAWELVELVRSIIKRLDFNGDEQIKVSYSGGLFKTREAILKPFRKHLEGLNVCLATPRYSPIVGAIAYSARRFLSQKELDGMLGAIAPA